MADYSAYGPWVGDDWRAWVGVYVTSNTDTSVTFRVESWAWSQYGTTSGYNNIRGGVAYGNNAWDRGSATSISQNSWKKLYEKSYTINKTHVSQSVKCWALAEGISGTYSGSSSTATVNITIGAKKSYKVTFNANSGSGAPSAQTKWINETLTLSTVKPTRSGYTFLGWATSSSATSATYAAGGSYTANAAATLYAVWKLNYTAPKLTSPTVRRCDSQGDLDDEGTYAKLELGWSVDTTGSGTLATNGLTVKWRQRGTSSWGTATTLASGGTSGSVSTVLGSGTTFDIGKAYEVMITAKDSHNLTTSQTIVLSPAYSPMEFLAGGKGVSFGKPATRAGLDIAMVTYHGDSVVLDNNKALRAYDGNGVSRSLFVLDANGNLQINWGMWDAAAGITYLNGNTVAIRSKAGTTINGYDADSTAWVYLAGSSSGNRVRYCKRSGIVHVEVWYESSAGVGTSAKTLGTLPAGFRPDVQVETAAFGNTNNLAMLRVNPGGSIVAKSMSGTMNYFKGAISFPV